MGESLIHADHNLNYDDAMAGNVASFVDFADGDFQALASDLNIYDQPIPELLMVGDRENLGLYSDASSDGNTDGEPEHSPDMEPSPGAEHGVIHRTEGRFALFPLPPFDPCPTACESCGVPDGWRKDSVVRHALVVPEAPAT